MFNEAVKVLMNQDQILTLRDLIESWPHDFTVVAKPYATPAEQKGQHFAVSCQRCQLEELVETHLVIHVTEGLEPDDADFIYRHVIGRRPKEMP